MPLEISVESTLGPLIDALDGLSGRRILSITASTLTATGAELQKSLQTETSNVFDRPTAFTVQGVFRTRANAENLEVIVGFKDQTGSNISPAEYLQAELQAGHRALKRSELALQAKGLLPQGYETTPGPSARLDAYGNMSRGLIVQILSGLQAFNEQGYIANRTARSATKRALPEFFVIRVGDTSHLGPGIYQRASGGFRKVINFVPLPSYRQRFNLEAVSEASINANFERLFVQYAEASIGRLKAQQSGG